MIAPRFEQGELAFLIGGNLPERMQRAIRGFFHRTERNQANLVSLAHFLKRPACAHVACESFAAIGRSFEGGEVGVIGRLQVMG